MTKKRQEVVVICEMCGKEFAAKRSFAKRCPECKKIVARLRSRERYRKHRAEDAPSKHSPREGCGDSVEMRKLCLNCTRYSCPGECEELANLARDSKQRRKKTSGGKVNGT